MASYAPAAPKRNAVSVEMRSTSAEDGEGGMTGEQVGRFYAATNRVHDDGTLRTRHLSTNVRIDIDVYVDVVSPISVVQIQVKQKQLLKSDTTLGYATFNVADIHPSATNGQEMVGRFVL